MSFPTTMRGFACPKCKKKTCSWQNDWDGSPAWNDTTRYYCRSCGARFKKTTATVTMQMKEGAE